MLISVALCTHNGAGFIEEQLRSILNQSVLPGEIVVSDDASHDDTLQIVTTVFEAWRAQNPVVALKLRILRNITPLGVTANFEQALTACRGDLIALCDQDDVWRSDRLEIMATEFEQRPELLLLNSDARLVDETGNPTGQALLATLGVSKVEQDWVHSGNGIDALLRRNIVTGATTVLRRSLIERATPFPPTWVHDEWLAIVAAATGEIDLIEAALVDYRQHGGNQIGASSLDFAGKFGRLRAERTERNQRLLARVEALRERVGSFVPPASAKTLARIDAKLNHERMRSQLPVSRLRRIVPVMKAWRSGDYSSFGLGMQDVVRDLMQPGEKSLG
ncbi:hypothetical protein GCM10022381_16220 [Leifsonia kafniensis]|uniref:Glycosyltransferase 2-like domain-containing protein n=1 Tax=Leifsonia kafniensis TaxID=475957 RepID=A0ABP7KFL1_9MICO